MKSIFALLTLALVVLSSCTVVTTTNVPGQQLAKFPKTMIGKFELQYPEEFQAMMAGSDAKTIVTIKADQLNVKNAEGDNTSMLGDSLFVSTIGKQTYLSLGGSPSIMVFKVVMAKKNIQLYPMFGGESMTAADLQPFFTSVNEVEGEPTEDGQPGMPSYEVTIDDSKLDSYFNSELPMKSPFVLKKIK